MGVLLPHPSGKPNMPGKFSKIVVGHKLLDAKRIWKNIHF